jgi:hypothetical protein
MHFYALRIVCDRCRDPFVVGGSQKSDLARWHGLVVDCPRCGAVIQAATGEVIDLSPPRLEPPAPEALAAETGLPRTPPQAETEH